MSDWKKALLQNDEPVSRAIEVIDAKSSFDDQLLLPRRIALIVGDGNKLLGVITDGDIRRGILQGYGLTTPVCKIMNSKFSSVCEGTPREEILAIMRDKGFAQMPILSKLGQIVGLELLEDFTIPLENYWVVLMAGGMGTRLGDLTKNCPKPLIEVCGKPVIETILSNFIKLGFKKFFIVVNYLAEKIIDRVGDGSKWGVSINYLREAQRFGTAGGLSLLPTKPENPIIVMNGDVITKLSITHLIDFHNRQNSFATMCVREYDIKVPFGVARVENSNLLHIDEKPVQRFFVNAGIYVLAPDALDLIIKDTLVDMPDFFNFLIKAGKKASAFPIREYWIDIGRVEDLHRARSDYPEVFYD